MWVEFLILTVCVIGLWLGGSWIVDSAARIARRIGMSELVIGLTIVAIGISAPEFAVTIAAALNGQSDISVANVVGSNIFNLGFILGGVALVAGIPTTRKLVWRDGMMLIGATVMLVGFSCLIYAFRGGKARSCWQIDRLCELFDHQTGQKRFGR